MPHDSFVLPTAKRHFLPHAEPLECRALLSGAAVVRQDVAIQVPSAYISQQSSQLDVTLVRTTASGRDYSRGTVTVNFTATSGAVDGTMSQFTPVNETVTFPAGQSTETVVVPINAGAANPGLVPISLAVTSATQQVKGSGTRVFLASGPEAIPPSITGVQRVAGGIAVTFSKAMAPATVANIHNYAIRFSPSQQFSLANLYGVGLVQTLANGKRTVPLRRASYDPTTNTVTLVATEQLGSKGSYEISNPVSLLAKKSRPGNAQPLTDLEGNVLDQGKSGGAFAITIRPGKPFSAPAPTLAVEA